MDWIETRQTFLGAGTGTTSSTQVRKCILTELTMCEYLLTCDPVPHKAVRVHFERLGELTQKVLFPLRPASVYHFMTLFADPSLKTMFPNAFSHARSLEGKKVGSKKGFFDSNEHSVFSGDESENENEESDDDESDEGESSSSSSSDEEEDENESESESEKDDVDDSDNDGSETSKDTDFNSYCIKMGYLSSLRQICTQVQSAAMDKKQPDDIVQKLSLLNSVLRTDETSAGLKKELAEKLKSESGDFSEWSLAFVSKVNDFVYEQTSLTARGYTKFLGIK